MSKRFAPLLLLFCILLVGCASAAAPRQMNNSAPGPAAAPAAPVMGDASGATQQKSAEDSASAIPALEPPRTDVSGQRIVIMNATLSIVVSDPAAAMKTITDMAGEMGGFVVSSNLFKTRTQDGIEVPQANIAIRVPAARLTEAMGRIKALVGDQGTDILTETVTGQDVTKEYTDLKSRLANLEQAKTRLENILDKATKTEDVLAVYNQLTQVTEQIEVLKGQIKYYDESAALSAISVGVQSKAAVAPLTIGGWKPVGVARDAAQALINVLKFLGNSLIYIVIFCLPIIILLGTPAFFIIRGFLRWRARRKAEKVAKAGKELTDKP